MIMPYAQEERDEERDARRYRALLLALDSITDELSIASTSGASGQPCSNIDELLAHVLPQLCEALNGASAFAARVERGIGGHSEALVITAAHPQENLPGQALSMAPVFRYTLDTGEAVVLEELEGPGEVIEGLEPLQTRSAILARLQSLEDERLIAVCDKSDPAQGPFLVSDKLALDNVLELIAIGVREGQRQARELGAMIESLAAISCTMDLECMLPRIAKQVADAFAADAVGLFLSEDGDKTFRPRGCYGLSAQYRDNRVVRGAEMASILMAVRQGVRYGIVRDLPEEPWAQSDLARSESLRSVLITPLLNGDEGLVGVLAIYSKDVVRGFTPHEGQLAEVFAGHIAVAIQNARLYQDQERRRADAHTLAEASKAILRGFTKDLQTVLDEIVSLVVKNVRDPVCFVSLTLYDSTAEELEIVSIYPDADGPELKVKRGDRWSIRRKSGPDHLIGVSGRALEKGMYQLVSDVKTDPDYRESFSRTRSELALPLLDGTIRKLGVLSIQSDQPAAFDESDIPAREGMAELATLALRIADHRSELMRANAIAALGAWGADMAHELNSEIGAIRRSVYLLGQQEALSADALGHLDAIDRAAANLRVIQLPEDVIDLESGALTHFYGSAHQTIRILMDQFQRSNPDVKMEFRPTDGDPYVAMHKQWLRRIMLHLLRNAMGTERPMGRRPVVSIHTTIVDRMCHIKVVDNGVGVPREIEPLLFQQPINTQPGRGRGLLIADLVARQHGGRVWLESNQPGNGACFAFAVPLVSSLHFESDQHDGGTE
jgi:signal transduction histidine kinase